MLMYGCTALRQAADEDGTLLSSPDDVKVIAKAPAMGGAAVLDVDGHVAVLSATPTSGHYALYLDGMANMVVDMKPAMNASGKREVVASSKIARKAQISVEMHRIADDVHLKPCSKPSCLSIHLVLYCLVCR